VRIGGWLTRQATGNNTGNQGVSADFTTGVGTSAGCIGRLGVRRGARVGSVGQITGDTLLIDERRDRLCG